MLRDEADAPGLIEPLSPLGRLNIPLVQDANRHVRVRLPRARDSVDLAPRDKVHLVAEGPPPVPVRRGERLVALAAAPGQRLADLHRLGLGRERLGLVRLGDPGGLGREALERVEGVALAGEGVRVGALVDVDGVDVLGLLAGVEEDVAPGAGHLDVPGEHRRVSRHKERQDFVARKDGDFLALFGGFLGLQRELDENGVLGRRHVRTGARGRRCRGGELDGLLGGDEVQLRAVERLQGAVDRNVGGLGDGSQELLRELVEIDARDLLPRVVDRDGESVPDRAEPGVHDHNRVGSAVVVGADVALEVRAVRREHLGPAPVTVAVPAGRTAPGSAPELGLRGLDGDEALVVVLVGVDGGGDGAAALAQAGGADGSGDAGLAGVLLVVEEGVGVLVGPGVGGGGGGACGGSGGGGGETAGTKLLGVTVEKEWNGIYDGVVLELGLGVAWTPLESVVDGGEVGYVKVETCHFFLSDLTFCKEKYVCFLKVFN